ncbi:MAG: hypothetical protein J6N55_09445 [Anaerovibrio sp.]|uniref:Serine O-acetyltransferase n=1 Tax=Anaerovibrio lipolyticus DSM 3074 TaxID=1120997 RepID=A0A1M6C1X7_9FIRM|nr:MULTISPECIES: hypothetical protein [Anaerovibrio]MBO6246489.1 hypothetical protein [Anaerovibrio sp.]SHI55019.1 serine O-acetyltransferase [Anaerovibrio lipolyticus DSM 3074]
MINGDKKKSIKGFIIHQLNNFYCIKDSDLFFLDQYLDESIARTLNCFKHLKNKYYSSDDINLLHSGQYFIFLYYLANTIYNYEIKEKENYRNYLSEARKICDKLYCLNKAFASCDVYYEVELPEYFSVDHPVGSVIGRASIGSGFSFIQGCTVGGNNGIYPVIGNNVFMFSNSKILGKSIIGNNVLIGANCYIKDMKIQDNVMVFGQYPNIIIKENYNNKIQEMIGSHFQ